MNRLFSVFLLCSCFLLSSCLNTMKEQDYEFVEKIKAHLKKKGDSVKISDIHSGDWQSVCFTAYGASDDAIKTISRLHGIPEKEVVVINRKRDQTNHSDDFIWGIFFYYPPNKIEYYVVYRDVMLPANSKVNCASKEGAYFTASSDYSIKGNVNNYIFIGLSEHTETD